MDPKIEKLIESITREVIGNLNFGQMGHPGRGPDKRLPVFDRKLAAMIDHTLLKPEATAEEVKKLCTEAKQYGFASVCINPSNVILAFKMLKGSGIPVCCVVGFPLGVNTTRTKAFEAREAIENGAREIDMVINIGALKSKEHDRVKNDIEEVMMAARGKAIVKVIIEACLLEDHEKIKACELAKEAGADFVKTSTGFSESGATTSDIRLMREVVGPGIGVKAAGGIRDYGTAMSMLKAGACSLGMSDTCRIGASSSISIVSKGK